MVEQSNPRALAEAKFAAKEARLQEGRRAMRDYEAQIRRVDDNTARLRALRLAKEAADDTERAKTPARPKASKQRKLPKR